LLLFLNKQMTGRRETAGDALALGLSV
jgi:hypothetical protein